MREFLENFGGGVAGAAAIGAAAKFLFQEKIDTYVNGLVAKKMNRTNERLDKVEERMTEAEKQSALFAQTMQTVAREFNEGVTRLTTTIQRVEDRQSETAEAVARIEGAMERRTRSRE